jgi:hypothetical protein
MAGHEYLKPGPKPKAPGLKPCSRAWAWAWGISILGPLRPGPSPGLQAMPGPQHHYMEVSDWGTVDVVNVHGVMVLSRPVLVIVGAVCAAQLQVVMETRETTGRPLIDNCHLLLT